MAFSKPRLLRWGIPLTSVALLLLAHTIWLRAMGDFLVSAQQPFKAGMIVVLAGDDHGNRILKAAELVKQSYAPLVLVSGPRCCYGNRESDLAIEFAVRQGFPREWFIAFPITGKSTREEAREIVGELDRRGIDRFVVVTSDYHTRRAGKIYSHLVSADRFRVVAANDWAFHADRWWRTREGQKQVFYEWSKTIASWAGI